MPMIRASGDTKAALERVRGEVGARSIADAVRLLALVADAERGGGELRVRVEGEGEERRYPAAAGILARARAAREAEVGHG